ncbi:M23 family metallopeptidase [Sphingomonas sp. BT-65]|uniref:M23 family metallopeptidase n=1 Tax=Sphingomonas sp. BT-65 TaxID=2989821 RepID=UPI00223697CA|nr:M23 family metallopeptidase [Sphingomonas sp. BT-65]MCW4462610.1 M23 family metallopeptidase [Sphingomonas sp. BT-65]
MPLILLPLALVTLQTAETPPPPQASAGIYRLPYADGTQLRVFDDTRTHRPRARIDLVAMGPRKPYRIVAAAAGTVMAIQDSYGERQSGRAASECRNNFVWIAHPNGEWTGYSHMAKGSVTGLAKLKVGQKVRAGQLLGIEGDVGCAMLEHLHFEVAVPDPARPVDAGGFLTGNDGSKRNREPRFCGISGTINKEEVHTAKRCAG